MADAYPTEDQQRRKEADEQADAIAREMGLTPSPGSPMTANELQGLLNTYRTNAETFALGKLGKDRQRAYKYYYRREYGNERVGRSSVRTSEVYESIELIMPDLMRIFCGTDDPISYAPAGPGDEEEAEQARQYAEMVLDENEKYLRFVQVTREACQAKNAYLKVYYDETPRTRQARFEELRAEDLEQMLQDPQVELVDAEAKLSPTLMEPNPETGEMEPVELYDVLLRRTFEKGGVRIDNVASENLRVLRETVSLNLDDAIFIQERVKMRRAVLKEMDPPEYLYPMQPPDDWNPDIPLEPRLILWQREREVLWHRKVDQLPSDRYTSTPEEQTKQTVEDTRTFRMSAIFDAIQVAECYIRCDYYGDGVDRLVRVLAEGDTKGEIFSAEVVEYQPYCTFTPNVVPNKHYGWSTADETTDLQLISSTLMRGTLDNMYLANNARPLVRDGAVNYEDVLSPSPFRPWRIKKDAPEGPVAQHAQLLSPPNLMGNTVAAMELIRQQREQRTGAVGTESQAPSAHTTLGGLNRIMDTRGMRTELIARTMAETGFKQLYEKIYELALRHERQEVMVRVTGTYKRIQPGVWKGGCSVRVTLGMGAAYQERQAASLMQILELQKEALPQGGADYQKMWNTVSRLIKLFGWKTPEDYFVPPEEWQPTPPQPTPEQIYAESQAEKVRLDAANDAAKIQLDRDKALLEYQVEAAKLIQDGQEVALEDARERAELMLKAAQIKTGNGEARQ